MPDPWKDVTVQVISKGKVLDFYHDPDEDPTSISPMICQRYVEAVTDAIFKIRVALTPNFPLYCLQLDDAVRISVKYDGQRSWYVDLSTMEILRARNKALPAEYTFARTSRYCNDSHQWISGETTFGALTTSDMAPSLAKAEDLGKIEVRIHRIHRTKRAFPLFSSTDISDKPIVEVSEKTLKGKAIANTVCTANDTSDAGPPPTTYDTTSIDGVGGDPLKFSILYRSKHILQMLGCIPRTPSPDVISRKRKIVELRAQLALLEGAGNVKAESLGSRATVKRELADAENAGSRKRSRTSGPIETIDLTGD